MAEPIDMQLETLCGGGVAAQFALALAEVAKSIQDVNTDAESKRQVVLTLTFEPDADRRVCTASAQINTKLPGRSPLRTIAYVKTRAGGAGFIEQAPPEQQVLDEVANFRPAVHAGGKA